jgi:hypothetical protein
VPFSVSVSPPPPFPLATTPSSLFLCVSSHPPIPFHSVNPIHPIHPPAQSHLQPSASIPVTAASHRPRRHLWRIRKTVRHLHPHPSRGGITSSPGQSGLHLEEVPARSTRPAMQPPIYNVRVCYQSVPSCRRRRGLGTLDVARRHASVGSHLPVDRRSSIHVDPVGFGDSHRLVFFVA